MNNKQVIIYNLLNMAGWHTKRHILVIESDDWGSIRMPSLLKYNELVDNGIKFGKYGYEKVDTIASPEDLELLFEICDSFRDINGKPLVITANVLVANPDFDKIKASNYCRYYYERITSTMDRYYPNRSPFLLWKEGMEKKVFHPQLHGREHINVPMWLNSLQKDYFGARDCFECGVFSFLVNKTFDSRIKNTSAYDYKNSDELVFLKQSIVEADSIFYELFGYHSLSFIAPSYTWNQQIEQSLFDIGVKYLQGMILHTEQGKKHINYIGKRNSFGQFYLNRTASWEYSQNSDYDWTNDCLERINIAFKWNKPATISIHRLNFVGALSVRNRDDNLKRFNFLISQIIRRWPDVEFWTSDQLGHYIERGDK